MTTQIVDGTTDVVVSCHGSLYTVQPLTDDAREWVEDNVCIPCHMRLGTGFAVEHRQIADLVDGMHMAGLIVR